jgi:hypothetical protein
VDLWSGEWVAAFFLSPAVTGVAAVVAATIGLRVARVRARVDRDLAAEQHRRDREAEITRLVFEPLPPPPVYGLRRLWLAWRERRERGRARG